ncbi:MAG: hypothetical protein ACYSRR_08005 [Planctomycetota bacterium]|jgi:hypothetical protein
MSVKQTAKHILFELKGHAPFTFLGAILGIFFMLIFAKTGWTGNRVLFTIFHPAHVLLSAMVTASMFRLHAIKRHFVLILIVSYFGSVGIATLSDVIIPHIGTHLLRLNIPSQAALDHHENKQANQTDQHDSGLHLGFIEEWYIVNPAAVLGVIIAFFLPRTKFPHTLHVLISTWASSSYLLMSHVSDMTVYAVVGIFVTLVISTWLPCCISDIIFPLLFVKSDVELADFCPVHRLHSHPHLPKQPEQNQ